MSTEIQTENRTTSAKPTDATTPWTLFALSGVGMVVFAWLYFSAPKATTKYQILTLTNNVINTVTNELIKEVPKMVEVPTEIPPQYLFAMEVLRKQTNAPLTGPDQALFQMKDVRVNLVLDDIIKQVVSEDEAKAKFELTLRRNNVPLNPTSPNVVFFGIGGFFDNEAHTMLCYQVSCSVDELHTIWRNGECRAMTVRVWNKGGSYGTVGRNKASEGLLQLTEKCAEIFANDFLTANPK